MTVLIPTGVWTTLLDEFSRHDPRVERVAYLDGYTVDISGYPSQSWDTTTAVVTALVFPDAHLTAGNFTVSSEAMGEAGEHLRTRKMTRLAQVHTHGDNWVNHSSIDDANAYTQRPGAVSIVLPHHAVWRPDPVESGVLVRRVDGWWRVPSEQVKSYVELVPSTYDFREPTCLTTPIAPNPPLTTGIFSQLWAWLRRSRRQ